MYKQRGGVVTVSGYLLTLLIAAGLGCATMNIWLSSHRTIELNQKVSCAAVVFT